MQSPSELAKPLTLVLAENANCIEPVMNIDSNDLLKQLTSRRQPSDEELEVAIGRAVLRVLRHGDPEFELRYDYFGLFDFKNFVSHIRDQVESLARDRFLLTIDHLIAMEKIEIRCDKIRALYGHSLPGIIVGRMKWPKVTLFHATCQRHLSSIFENGLKPQSRTWVHLTSDIEYANRILQNHSFYGPTVLLRIDTDQLENFDVTFRKPNSHVWLANYIPPAAIRIVRPNDHSEFAPQSPPTSNDGAKGTGSTSESRKRDFSRKT